MLHGYFANITCPMGRFERRKPPHLLMQLQLSKTKRWNLRMPFWKRRQIYNDLTTSFFMFFLFQPLVSCRVLKKFGDDSCQHYMKIAGTLQGKTTRGWCRCTAGAALQCRICHGKDCLVLGAAYQQLGIKTCFLAALEAPILTSGYFEIMPSCPKPDKKTILS